LTPDAIASALAGLGYPGFSWRKRGKPVNPAAVLVAALLRTDLEYRLAEALPWLVATFPALDWDWVIGRTKLADVQNRLGFVVQLALSHNPKAAALKSVLNRLERARLCAGRGPRPRARIGQGTHLAATTPRPGSGTMDAFDGSPPRALPDVS
jgi:hypothetical protein